MKLRLKTKKHSLKVVSLITGLILWFYVLNAARITVEKTITLQYVLPDHAVFAIKPPQEAIVTLEGPRAFMRSLLERDEKIVVDISRPPWRDSLRPQPVLKSSDLVLPFGVKVEKISPRILPLRLERKASKLLPVKLVLTGDLPQDLQIQNMQIRPTEVEVVGPRSLIQGMKEITTKPIEIESLYGQTNLSLEWNLPDERLVVSKGGNPQITYGLKAKRANMVLEKVPVRLLGEGVLPRQQTVAIVLWAPPDVVRRVDKSDLNVQVWAEVPEGSKKAVEVELRAVLPPRLHLVEIRPKRILVEPR
ncbi:MAG: hypothetical protein K2P81_00410 [Bacteriovoracaceae bacterium]|nr:hypothetical protein [Bacteriovoracaceae bacterium]